MDAISKTKRLLTDTLLRCGDMILPPLCLACRRRVYRHSPYCFGCMRGLCRAGWRSWVPDAAREGDMPETWSVFRFDPEVGRVIHSLKYADFSRGHAFMTRWLRDVPNPFDGAHAEGLIPVPLHALRQRERGFNQSRRWADDLAALWGLTVRDDVLQRSRATTTQTRQSESGRAKNLCGAFRCRRSDAAAGKTWILVDDVTTTGATLQACRQALLDAGATRVLACTLAWVPRRTVRESSLNHAHQASMGSAGEAGQESDDFETGGRFRDGKESIAGIRPGYVHLS